MFQSALLPTESYRLIAGISQAVAVCQTLRLHPKCALCFTIAQAVGSRYNSKRVTPPQQAVWLSRHLLGQKQRKENAMGEVSTLKWATKKD